MKRTTLALALCIGLCACSGQRNQDTNRGLGSGGRDAETDADDGEPQEDAEVPGDEEDAGTQGGDGGVAEDAGGSDAGTLDASSADAGTVDAGSDGTKLRVIVPYNGPLIGLPIPAFRPAVVFSLADGGVQSLQEADDAGLVVSDTAPAMVTASVYSDNIGLNHVTEFISVLAPALGDTLDFTLPPRRMTEEQPTEAYQVSAANVPSDAYDLDLYAGAEGCAQGYLELMPAPTAPAAVRAYSDCALENPGTLLAIMRDTNGSVLRYGAAQVTSSNLPSAVTLDQWLVPDTLTIALNGTQPSTRSESQLSLRKGLLRLLMDYPDAASPDSVPYQVPRSIAESFDATGGMERRRADDGTTFLTFPQQHLFGKNRPAATPSISFDLAERLPGATSISPVLEPVFTPSVSWTAEPGAASADAVVATFSWSWRGGDSITRVIWHVIAPPDTLRVAIPALPTMTSIGLPTFEPNPDETWFETVEYYDSDAQDGYRAFLTEPIRTMGSDGLGGGDLRASLARKLPVGGTLRASSTLNPRP